MSKLFVDIIHGVELKTSASLATVHVDTIISGPEETEQHLRLAYSPRSINSLLRDKFFRYGFS